MESASDQAALALVFIVATPGGADNILYGVCLWQLEEGQALLLEVERPDADYWSFVSHTLTWLESGDFDQRQTSLNDEQAFIDPDGRVRRVDVSSSTLANPVVERCLVERVRSWRFPPQRSCRVAARPRCASTRAHPPSAPDPPLPAAACAGGRPPSADPAA